MANVKIQDLVEATELLDSDLFVLSQYSQAKKLTGKALKETLLQNVVINDPTAITHIEQSSTTLKETITIHYVDGTNDVLEVEHDETDKPTSLVINGHVVPWTVVEA